MSVPSVTAVRHGLLGKVCTLLAPSLAISAFGTYLGADITNGWAIFALAMVFIFGSWFVQPALRVSKAFGTLVLLAWVFESGVFIGPAIHAAGVKLGWQTVFDAYLFTGLAMCAFGAYGFLRRDDLSHWYKFLFWALLALIAVMFVNIFVHFGAGGQMLLSLAGMAIFSVLFVVDFNRVSHDDDTWENAFDASIQIYLDYMNFLLFFLQFSGASSSKD